MNMNFCPNCAHRLNKNAEGFLACYGDGHCGEYVFWNNPTPIVAAIVPYYINNIPNLEIIGTPQPNGIILVQRGMKSDPHFGEWCLPCGFLDEREDPYAGVKRECIEEIHREIEIVKYYEPIILRDTNRLLLLYEAKCQMGDGVIEPGDDASAAGVFNANNLPKIAFPSHKKIIDEFFTRNNIISTNGSGI